MTGPVVNGERFAPGYTPEAAAYEQHTRPQGRMMEATIRWRKVNAAEAERNGIYCLDDCENLASWSRQWQTDRMSAPAFWYFCEGCATVYSYNDGIDLKS